MVKQLMVSISFHLIPLSVYYCCCCCFWL